MITETDVLEALQVAVDDYGFDWVDPFSATVRPCRNVYRDGDDYRMCMAAHAMHTLGVSFDFLQHYNNDGARRVMTIAGVEINAAAAAMLDNAQQLQDSGISWGEILREIASW